MSIHHAPDTSGGPNRLSRHVSQTAEPYPPASGAALALILLYLCVVLAPLVLILIVGKRGDDPFAYKIGLSVGLVGFSLLVMQFVLAARLRWVERPFGMDMVYQFHRAMGVFVGVLLLTHPVILAAAHHKWSLLFGLHVHWYIWVGRAALLLLVVHALLAVFRSALRMEYQRWQALHSVLALLLLVGGFVHSWYAGGDLKPIAMKVLWWLLFGGGLLAYFWHRFRAPARLRPRPYTVMEVRQEAKDVWTVCLAPERGTTPPEYLPGQYHYLTLCRDGLPVEEHPFTISSSPTQRGMVSSTIKASGDFTQTIGQTRPGDTVLVDAPFGRFSYLLHPEEKELVFIAGGVGITPLMSMLRHLHDTQNRKPVLLLYANQAEDSIIFRKELDALENAETPLLKVVHVLSKPGEGWEGERGRLDDAKIKRYCSEFAGKGFYICGPPKLNDAVAAGLQGMGVPDRHIHFERFDQ